MGKLVMGYWDCPYCGTKGVAGNVMNCPGCGRARGDVKFYMKNGADAEVREAGQTGDIEYLSEEQAKDFDAEADWYCSFCNSLNRNRAAFCSNCGATRESSESNYFDQLKKRQEQEAAEQAAQARNQSQSSARAAQTRKGGKSRLLILLAVLAAIVGLFVYLNGNATKSGLTVTDIAWNRSIPVESYKNYTEEDWSIPQGGTQVSSSSKLHHYDQVLDHYESVEVQKSRSVLDHYETYTEFVDQGNGSFMPVEKQQAVYGTEYYTETESRPVYRSEPRYATWYVYTIWRWKQDRIERSSGTDHEAAWPELNLQENEREGSPRVAEYAFTVEDEKGERSTWTLEEPYWRNISPGDKLSISAKRTGGKGWIVDSEGNQVAELERK